jgi:hypothetical protein
MRSSMNLPVDVGLGDMVQVNQRQPRSRRSRPVPLQPTNRLRQDRRPRGPHEFSCAYLAIQPRETSKRLSNRLVVGVSGCLA